MADLTLRFAVIDLEQCSIETARARLDYRATFISDTATLGLVHAYPTVLRDWPVVEVLDAGISQGRAQVRALELAEFAP